MRNDSIRNKRNSKQSPAYIPVIGTPKKGAATPAKKKPPPPKPELEKPGQRGTTAPRNMIKGKRRSIVEQKKYNAEQKKLKEKFKNK